MAEIFNGEKQRIIQEFVPGKQVTLAHIIANPNQDIYKKLGVIGDHMGAIGIMTITPSEAAIIGADVASKAAILGLTRHTALRFVGTNVRCNAICPGTIVTPMVAGMNPANMDMNIFGQMMKHNDLKVQPCFPEDVANMLLFFASDESRAITGQAIVTDFGSTL